LATPRLKREISFLAMAEKARTDSPPKKEKGKSIFFIVKEKLNVNFKKKISGKTY